MVSVVLVPEPEPGVTVSSDQLIAPIPAGIVSPGSALDREADVRTEAR